MCILFRENVDNYFLGCWKCIESISDFELRASVTLGQAKLY